MESLNQLVAQSGIQKTGKGCERDMWELSNDT